MLRCSVNVPDRLRFAQLSNACRGQRTRRAGSGSTKTKEAANWGGLPSCRGRWVDVRR